MGAGKTTVGRTVARRLNYPFFDSDHELEARCGVRIPIIFEHEGEAGFRDREAHIDCRAGFAPGHRAGHGRRRVLRPENREVLRANGTVVYLRASPHDLWLRTRHDRNRPLLQTQDPKAGSRRCTPSATRSTARWRISSSKPASRPWHSADGSYATRWPACISAREAIPDRCGQHPRRTNQPAAGHPFYDYA